MVSYTLKTRANDITAIKVLVAAEYTQLPVTLEETKDDIVTFETPKGSITRSASVAKHIAAIRPDYELTGNGTFSASLVNQWLDYTTVEVEPLAQVWLYPIYKFVEFNGQAYAAAKKQLRVEFDTLNKYFATNTFLVGERLSLADIALAGALYELYSLVLTSKFMKPFGNLNRWFETVVNQQAFISVKGEFKQAAKETQAPKPKKQKAQKKQKGQQKQQKKQQQAKKVKKKAPFSEYPRSKMSLDAVKKLYYAKKQDYAGFFAEFYEMFDAEGYSLFLCNYNYNAENKVDFQTSNLAAGFVQRCDAMRDYAFGILNITAVNEDTPPYNIEGAWLIRGNKQEIPKEFLENNPDAEYYTWKKVDLTNAAQKKQYEDQWSLDKLNGLEVVDQKVFK